MDISSLSVQDITTYLKNVLDTESSLLKQKMVRQEARNCLQFEEPPREEIKMTNATRTRTKSLNLLMEPLPKKIII